MSNDAEDFLVYSPHPGIIEERKNNHRKKVEFRQRINEWDDNTQDLDIRLVEINKRNYYKIPLEKLYLEENGPEKRILSILNSLAILLIILFLFFLLYSLPRVINSETILFVGFINGLSFLIVFNKYKIIYSKLLSKESYPLSLIFKIQLKLYYFGIPLLLINNLIIFLLLIGYDQFMRFLPLIGILLLILLALFRPLWLVNTINWINPYKIRDNKLKAI